MAVSCNMLIAASFPELTYFFNHLSKTSDSILNQLMSHGRFGAFNVSVPCRSVFLDLALGKKVTLTFRNQSWVAALV